mgnify:CR=1 FL=1
MNKNPARRRSGRVLGRGREGAVLGLAMVVVLAVALLGTGALSLSGMNARATSRALSSAKAFWLAEAGVQRLDRRLFNSVRESIPDTDFGGGRYRVETHLDVNPPYAESIGVVQGEEQRIRVELSYLAPPYEHAVFAGNRSGVEWSFQMRGTGVPAMVGGRERGGRDTVNGNVYANGDIALYEQSRINPAPAPNTYQLEGDAEAVGNISVSSNAVIAGSQFPHVLPKPAPDLEAMGYATNHTYDIKKIFNDAGITSGYLPVGHPLRDVVVKNPSDRPDECRATPGDDYFFEPRSGFVAGTQKDARTPLNLGRNRIYYVDGHVWFNNHTTYGFRISGQATIVATADIHVSDNLAYASRVTDMLGLVALGKYDAYGTLRHGNVYFGDPEFGTLYTVDAFMFAANDFLYNTSANTGRPGEPTTGYSVFGNYAALNQVTVYRDWYTRSSSARPAVFDTLTGRWKDALDGAWITNATQLASLRHYQMTISYDERIRNQATQPPGLPKSGAGTIYGGIAKWDSLSLN